MLTWPRKDPDDVLDYEFDWASRLAAGETLSTSVFLLDAGDVVLGAQSKAGTVTKVWISGGTSGVVNTITNRITTNQGRQIDVSAHLRVRSTS